MIKMNGIMLTEVIKPLTWLIGSWSGEGKGEYPTMEPFEFNDQLKFSIRSDAFELENLIHFEQVARVKEGNEFIFKHWEAGFLRPTEQGKIELQVTHNTGRIEILEGKFVELDSAKNRFTLRFRSTLLHNSQGLVKARTSERIWTFENDRLRYLQSMCTEDVEEMTVHLDSILERSRKNG